MLRGILLGSAWGLVLGGGFLAVMSLTFPATVLPPPETAPEDTPQTAAGETDAGPDRLPSRLTAPERHDAAQVTRPDQDTLAAISPTDLHPGAPPQPPALTPGLGEGPETAPTVGLQSPAPETGVLPSPQAAPPAAPAPEPGPEIATRPAQPPRAEPGEEITGFPTGDLSETVMAPDAATADPAQSAEDTAGPEQPGAQTDGPRTADDLPGEASGPDQLVSDEGAEPAPEVMAEAAPSATETPGPDTPVTDASDPTGTATPPDAAPEATVPETATDDTAPPGPVTPDASITGKAEPEAPVTETGTPDPQSAPDATPSAAQASTPPDPAQPESAPQPPSAPPTVAMPGAPATRLTADAPAQTGDTTTDPEADPATDQTLVDAPDDDLPPIDRYAAPFDNPEGRPIVSIVLIDSAGTGTTEDIPARFPYPISIAVPAEAPDATERMRRYRAAGYEVLALAALPPGATPADLETFATGWMAAVPEAVAIMEAPPHRLQAGRAIGEQLASVLADSGHGLLLFADGLDTTRKLASRRDVPAATVFRDLDGDGQGEAVVRRFLDHSAFKAGTEGSVILVARARPETLEALLVWGLADRASRVALAPVSYALKAAAP